MENLTDFGLAVVPAIDLNVARSSDVDALLVAYGPTQRLEPSVHDLFFTLSLVS